MKKRIIGLISIILIISVSLVYATNLSDLKNQLNNKQDSIDDKRDELNEIKAEQEDLLASIERISREINALEAEIDSLDSEINSLETDIEIKQQELEEKLAEIEEKEDLLKTRLVAMYKAGNVSMLDVLLGSEGISDFLSRYYYMSQVTEYDNELIQVVVEQKNKIEEIKTELEANKAKIEEDKKAVEEKSDSLEVSKKQLNAQNSKLESDKKALSASIDKLLAESNALEAQIRALQGTGSYAGGVMAWPLPGYTKITSQYGMRMHPTLHVYKMHTGVDIAGAGCNGKSIVAANSGKVITATFSSGYGNYVIIDHGGGITTLYAHASKLLVKKGDTVTRGQTIAKVGTTGYSTGPHLHFEVRKNGSTVNPLSYIQ
ncbi:MAG: peptidase M23 [Clostridiales bacterium]|nr:peptidase M23 [Clostridiales bacterium]